MKLADESLGRGDLGRGHGFGEGFLQLAGLSLSLGGGKVRPRVGLDVVLGYALAQGVHDTQAELSLGVSLIGSLAVPPHHLLFVLQDSLSLFVPRAQLELGGGVSLLGGG